MIFKHFAYKQLKAGTFSFIFLLMLVSSALTITLCACAAKFQNNTNFEKVSGIQTSPTPLPTTNQDMKKSMDSDLANSRRLWSQFSDGNYEMTISISVSSYSEPARKVKVRVRNGKAFQIERLDKNDNRSIDIYEHYDTVDKVFDRIQLSLEQGDTVKTSYHKSLGYPNKTTFFPKNSNAFIGVTINRLHFEK